MKKALFALVALLMLHPFVPAGAALVAGIAYGLTLGNPFSAHTKKWASLCLMGAVVGLGFGMDLLVVGRVGAQGVGYTALSILLTMAVGLALGSLLRVPRDASILLSAGTAICGGSAIAAVSGAIRADNEDVSIALATVFLLNAAALFVFPPIGHALAMSPESFGFWSALAIHDTSSVVGATLGYGGDAMQVGTTVKLARALWIGPLTFAIAMLYRSKSGKGKVTIPWFIFGFVGAAALVTFVPSLRESGQVLASGARRLLVFVLFLIGANLTRATLRNVGIRPFVQGLGLWIFAGGVSLAAISFGWVHL